MFKEVKAFLIKSISYGEEFTIKHQVARVFMFIFI